MMHEVREGEELLCRIGRLALDLGVAEPDYYYSRDTTTTNTIRVGGNSKVEMAIFQNEFQG